MKEKANTRNKTEKEEAGAGYIQVSMVPLLDDCPRLFFLRLAGRASSSSGRKRPGRTTRRTPKPRFRRKIVSSDTYGIRGAVRFGSHSDEEIPIIARSRIDRYPWSISRAEIQLALYALLLSENGSRPTWGMIIETGSERRIKVMLRPKLLRRAAVLCGKAQAIRDMEEAPEGTPGAHCEGCPYSRNCLAVNELPLKLDHDLEEEGSLVRDTSLPDVDALPLYIYDQQAKLIQQNGRFAVEKNGRIIKNIKMGDVSQICIFGNVQTTTQALKSAFKRNIPVGFLSIDGWLRGVGNGFTPALAQRRLGQFSTMDDPEKSLDLAISLATAKIRNSRNFLRRNTDSPSSMAIQKMTRYARRATSASSKSRLRGFEGAAAAAYFSSFSTMLKQRAVAGGFEFSGRNRRPPKDEINAMLSFGYAMLEKDVTIALLLSGLDPMHGVYHSSRSSRPSLALDIMDPLRPLVVDSAVIRCINTGAVKRSDFSKNDDCVKFRKKGMEKFLREYENRLDTEVHLKKCGAVCSLRKAIAKNTEDLAKFMSEENRFYQPLEGK